MIIPKIIHQTWKNRRISKALKYLTNTWKKHHPNWQYCFWTDKDNREFVKSHFPGFLKIYDGFDFNIQRADVIRYLILYKMGGVYVDVDFECFANLEDLLKESSCVFAVEPLSHCSMHQIDNLICNAFIASIPNHPFMELLINETGKPVQFSANSNIKVMESTGPYMLTRVYQQFKNKESLTILDPGVVYPLSKYEVTCLLTQGKLDPLLQKKLDDSVAVHYWFNTWVDFKISI